MITPEAFQILTLALALAFVIAILIEMKHERDVKRLTDRIAALEVERAAAAVVKAEGR